VVTVNPTPNVVALPASQTICSGANTSIALSTTNGVAGATYSWTVVQSGVTGATADTGATINQTLTATGSTAGTATYTITPNAGGCNGSPITVIVTVNPLPDVVAAPNAEAICSGATTNINLNTSNGVAGATYSWTVVQSNVSGANRRLWNKHQSNLNRYNKYSRYSYVYHHAKPLMVATAPR
jgi:hypothetical protein